MITAKTVLVLGAGSSKEVGLPVSSELSAQMVAGLDIRFDWSQQLKNGDQELAQILIHAARMAKADPNDYLHAARRISAGLDMANSIDSFIDMHREDQLVAECGKLAIVSAILRAERQSTLFVGDLPGSGADGPLFPRAKETWFFGLARMLFDGLGKGELDAVFRNLTVINFNYDRCLEHFLAHALSVAYAIPLSDGEKLLEGLRIGSPCHPNCRQRRPRRLLLPLPERGDVSGEPPSS